MSLFGLNYDNLSNILDYLHYVDIFNLNCSILSSKLYLCLLSILKNYLNNISILTITYINNETILHNNNHVNWHSIYNTKDEIKLNIKKSKQILLWVYDCKIKVNKINMIEYYDTYHCEVNKITIEYYDRYKKLDIDMHLISMLFRIPTNCISIESNTSIILDTLKDVLIKYKPCRDAIRELILCAGSSYTSSEPDLIDLMSWPILKNVKKIDINKIDYLSGKGLINLFNGCPNIEYLEMSSEDIDDIIINDILEDLPPLLIFDKVTKVNIYNSISILTRLNIHFPNIIDLNLSYEPIYIDNILNNVIELPETLETLYISYNDSDNDIDIIKIFSIHKLINLKKLIIFGCDSSILIDVTALSNLPNLTELIINRRSNIKNASQLEFLPKRIFITYGKYSHSIL
jgi:hypothetical protein